MDEFVVQVLLVSSLSVVLLMLPVSFSVLTSSILVMLALLFQCVRISPTDLKKRLPIDRMSIFILQRWQKANAARSDEECLP